MNLLIAHHTYLNGMAFDVSNHRNHGVPYSVLQAPPPFAPSFQFYVPESRVIVENNPTLQDLIAVRAVCTFCLTPQGGVLAKRYNLVEGHLSFALFVNPDGSLMGTILDATSNWLGATSSAGLIKPNTWYTAEVRHDGINECTVWLNGGLVGRSYSARGPVRSVGPHGIAIGHWPETPGVYTLQGYIRETWVYKYDPAEAAKGLLNPCCVKRASLDRFVDRMKAEGFTANKTRDLAMQFLKFGLGVSGEVRGNDATTSQIHNNLCSQALAAFLRGDGATYTAVLAQLGSMATQQLTPDRQKQIHDEEEALFKSLPFKLKDWQELLKNLCLDRAMVDPKLFLELYKQRSQKNRNRQGKGGAGNAKANR
jgi:hypothetical protein